MIKSKSSEAKVADEEGRKDDSPKDGYALSCSCLGLYLTDAALSAGCFPMYLLLRYEMGRRFVIL